MGLLWVLPLAGGAVRGFDVRFFRFPPLVASPPVHALFSWPVFCVFAAIGILAAGLLFFPRRFGFPPPAVAFAPVRVRFPLHGRLGLVLLLVSWFLAWSRFDLPGPAEQHTFYPLWIGFIFFLDGLVFRRAGRSLFANRRRKFFLLFPGSALSWWYFEFLNRFVGTGGIPTAWISAPSITWSTPRSAFPPSSRPSSKSANSS
jgi:hypothetical protein